MWHWVFVQISKSRSQESLNSSFTDVCLFSKSLHQPTERERGEREILRFIAKKKRRKKSPRFIT